MSARATRQPLSPPTGWWGALLFVATEATIFGSLIGTYFYLRFQTKVWPPAGIEPPSVLEPVILTAALVSTTVPIVGAVRAARAGLAGRARALFALAVVIQAAYLAIQAHLFLRDLRDIPADSTSYAAIYHTLLGTHHLHVAIGLLLELWLLARLAGGLTPYRVTATRVVGMYWLFVNAMAVFVLLTQISPSL
jgi:heme/copper-type cytochrome/quinol oxidase subunit 3